MRNAYCVSSVWECNPIQDSGIHRKADTFKVPRININRPNHQLSVFELRCSKLMPIWVPSPLYDTNGCHDVPLVSIGLHNPQPSLRYITLYEVSQPLTISTPCRRRRPTFARPRGFIRIQNSSSVFLKIKHSDSQFLLLVEIAENSPGQLFSIGRPTRRAVRAAARSGLCTRARAARSDR